MIEILIFDEAEQFINDENWRKAIDLFRARAPPQRRTFLFSATYSDEAIEMFEQFVKSNHWFVTVGQLNRVVGLVSQTFISGPSYKFAKALIELLIGKIKDGSNPSF